MNLGYGIWERKLEGIVFVYFRFEALHFPLLKIDGSSSSCYPSLVHCVLGFHLGEEWNVVNASFVVCFFENRFKFVNASFQV